jgi:hypoxanthine phosphoribosyltransferase
MGVSSEVDVLIDQTTIQERVVALGRQIGAAYARGDLLLVSVLKGSFVFAADLMRAIDLPLAIDFLGLKSYGSAQSSSGVVRITSDLTHPIEGKDVLVVEDIVDTGLTMQYLLKNLATRAPRSLRLCSFLHKPARTLVETPIDYLGFTIDDVFVVGYGLDWGERYRNLPYLGVVKQGPGA